uniref:ZU5 domain-containing protein n=1 Tax=Romanomermis culicivorax TaxID=13658 RepID=A0A915KEI6_ROMCU
MWVELPINIHRPVNKGCATGCLGGDAMKIRLYGYLIEKIEAASASFLPNGSDSPRVRPPPPPAPSTPRSPHPTPARLTSTSVVTAFNVSSTSTTTATGPHTIAGHVNATTEGKNLLAVDGTTHSDFRRHVNRTSTGLAVKEDYVEVTSLPPPNDSGNTSSSTESNVTTIRRRPVYSASDVVSYSNGPNNSQTSFAPKMAQSNFVERGLSASKIKPPLAAKPNFNRHEPMSNVGQQNTILAHVRQIIGPEGGTLVSESTQVVLKIPPGALDTTEEIFFKVFQDSRYEPPLDRQKGE